MLGLFMGRKLLLFGAIGLAIAGLFGFYYYKMNSKNIQIIQLQNKAVVQKVKINNLHTKLIVQKVNTKNKVFVTKEKQIKKQIQKRINDVKKHIDVNSTIGTHSITL